MRSNIIADIGQSIKTHPLIAAGGPALIAVYLFWQDISPVLQGLDTTFVKLFGKDWLKNLLQSPYFALLLIVAVLSAIWRSGNKISKREQSDRLARQDERKAILALTTDLMRIFWAREHLRHTRKHLSECEAEVERCMSDLQAFKTAYLPRADRIELISQTFLGSFRKTYENCERLHRIISANGEFPVMTARALVSSNPPDDRGPVHPGHAWVDVAHNEPFFIAYDQNLRELNAFLQRVRRQWNAADEAVNAESEAFKDRYPLPLNFDG